MSTTLTHAMVDSLIALTVSHVDPSQTGLVTAALVSASVIDVDHIIYAIKIPRKFINLALQSRQDLARSGLHEMPGLLLVGIISVIIFITDPVLARVIFISAVLHLVQDWVIGKSYPFAPVDRTLVQYFKIGLPVRAIIEIIILIVFIILWKLYLSGTL